MYFENEPNFESDESYLNDYFMNWNSNFFDESAEDKVLITKSSVVYDFKFEKIITKNLKKLDIEDLCKNISNQEQLNHDNDKKDIKYLNTTQAVSNSILSEFVFKEDRGFFDDMNLDEDEEDLIHQEELTEDLNKLIETEVKSMHQTNMHEQETSTKIKSKRFGKKEDWGTSNLNFNCFQQEIITRYHK
jgi:hypothetical protein